MASWGTWEVLGNLSAFPLLTSVAFQHLLGSPTVVTCCREFQQDMGLGMGTGTWKDVGEQSCCFSVPSGPWGQALSVVLIL